MAHGLAALARTEPGLCFIAPCPYNASACASGSGRYNFHVNHQNSELTYPMVDATLARGAAPETILWQLFDCLPLTRQLLHAALPSTRLLCGPDVETTCARRIVFKPKGSGGNPFPKLGAQSAAALRASIHSGCRIHDAATAHDQKGGPHLRVRFLERERTNETASCGPKQRGLTSTALATASRLLPAALEAAGGAAPLLDVARIPVDPGGLCEQAARFANVDVLVSVHGAHLVLTATLRPGAVLLEVTPWANFEVTHFSALARAANRVTRVQLCAARPTTPPSDPANPALLAATGALGPSSEESACAKQQACRIRYLTCYGSDLPPPPLLQGSAGHSSCAPCRCVEPTLSIVARAAVHATVQGAANRTQRLPVDSAKGT